MRKFLALFILSFALLAVPAFAEGGTKGYVNCDVLNVRTSPSTSSEIVAKLSLGDEIELVYCDGNGWYNVRLDNGTTGFCSADYVSFDAPGSAESIISTAKSLLGRPYSYGSSGPGSFDCSGFTSYVYAANGVRLPRSSKEQSNFGTTVSRSELLPGDLVFFATGGAGVVSHVGIYIGNGNIIHAASGQGRVVINNLSESYYSSRYLWAKRVR